MDEADLLGLIGEWQASREVPLLMEIERLRAALAEMQQYSSALKAAHPLNGSDEHAAIFSIATWYKWKITAALRGDQ